MPHGNLSSKTLFPQYQDALVSMDDRRVKAFSDQKLRFDEMTIWRKTNGQSLKTTQEREKRRQQRQGSYLHVNSSNDT